MKFNNILIINTFGIGDVLFSTPLLKEIKGHLPHANIHFLCNRRNLDLLKNDPDISTILIYEKDDFRKYIKESKIRFFKALAKLISDIKKLNIDIAIDLSLNYQMSIILILAGVRMRVGFNYRDRGKLLTQKISISGFDRKHVVEHYLDLLKFLDLPPSGGYRLMSYTSSENKSTVDNFLKTNGLIGKVLIGIVAGGGKSWGRDAIYRRWPSDNFAYVGWRLSCLDDVRILIFGTLEEKEICDKICKKIGERAVSLCGTTGLDLLVEFISRCDLIICNEGGPLHIAVSQEIKTVSIFGPVNDRVYGPYPPSEKHRVLMAEDVDCRPCYKNFKHNTCENRACLEKIDKDRVVNAARMSLGLL